MTKTSHIIRPMASHRFISVLILSIFCLSSFATCEQQIREFYVAYMRNLEHNPAQNDSLCNACMTPALILQLREETRRSGADAIIRAQDVCEYGIRSLSVSPLTDGWYMVRYKWNRDSDYIEIPLKAANCESGLKILHITPTRLGSRYGDDLLPQD
mgnify:FL=1